MTRTTLTALMIILSLVGHAQSETHDFITYDTSISLANGPWSTDNWKVRISRPKSDTTQRPAIFMMEGQGEMGAANAQYTSRYGPHYWLNNGWDGGVQLGNGKHYPLLFTSEYVNNPYPSAPSYYTLLVYLIKTYHVKPRGVHLTGLSQGAFTSGSLIMYEQTAGDETGMKLVTSLTMLEGEPSPLPAPYSTWSRGTTAYKVWAAKYGGRYFYLEGSGTDNFRDGWKWAGPMNDTVPNSAYFSYENLGGGGHCCWNQMYDPNATNWTCVGTLGPYNAPSEVGTNVMGPYKAPCNLFQFMLRQGDTTLVGSQSVPVNKPPIAAITVKQSGSNWVVVDGTGSTDPDGTIDSAWFSIYGPAGNVVIQPSCALQAAVVGLTPGAYTILLTVWDNKGATGVTQIAYSVPVVTPTIVATFTAAGKTYTVYSDGTVK